ncbi:tail fiber assembly protein [Escherichia coli]
MSEYNYSPSENAFYAVALKSAYDANNTWPNDALDISDESAAEFMAEPPEGMIRVVGNDGYPAWEVKPEPTREELVAAADAEKQSLIDQANEYMNSKQWPGKASLGRLKGDELAQYNAWLDYLDELEAVDTSTAPDITWPDKPE